MQIKYFPKILLLIITTLNSVLFTQEWKSLGLEKEFISAIAVDWSNPDIIYVGSFSDFITGSVGGIFKTTNNGVNWDTLIRGVTVCDIDIHPINPKIIYAVLGLNALTIPGIIKSTDKGVSWIKADSGMIINSESGSRVLVIDPMHPDTLYAGTSGFSGGNFYRSTNGGNSWSDLNSPTLSSIISMTIDPKDPCHIYIGTDDTGKIYETKDAGNSWIITGLTYKGIIYDIQFDPDSNGKLYAGTSGYGFFTSLDGGKTWLQNNNGLHENETVFKIQFFKDNNETKVFINASASSGIYLLNKNLVWENYGNVGSWFIYIINKKIYVGSYAGIFVNDISTSVTKSINHSSSFYLYQNYPNPFNPTTTIKYALPKESDVQLIIYDIMGREVKTLVSSKQDADHKEIVWDGRNNFNEQAASGIYICRLKATSLENLNVFEKSIKLVLIK